MLAHDHDDAWIGGPGANTLGWMKNDREIYFQSERMGYSQLYAVSFEGGEARALTSGNWEVLNVRQSRDKSHFDLTATKDGPFETTSIEMSGRRRPADAPHRRARQAHRHGFARRALDRRHLLLHQQAAGTLRAGEPPAAPKRSEVTTSPAPEFFQYSWLDAPIVDVPGARRRQGPGALVQAGQLPAGGPGVVFVHGSGYLQNVDHWWSNYYHEYMFDHILMERGFTVIDVDYRGSAGYGRDWRTAIYEHMGGKDLDDIVDAAKYLAAEQGVDPKKIGLCGRQLRRIHHPDGDVHPAGRFRRRRGAAAGFGLGASTTTATPSDILNLPQNDPDAYRKSSPIYLRRRV